VDKIHYNTREPFRKFLWCCAYNCISSVPRIYTRRIIAMIRADRSGPSIPFAEAHCESVQAVRRATYQAASEPARNERWLVHHIVRALCTRNKSMLLTKAMWKLIGHSRWDLDRDRINSGRVRWPACCLFTGWKKASRMWAQERRPKSKEGEIVEFACANNNHANNNVKVMYRKFF